MTEKERIATGFEVIDRDPRITEKDEAELIERLMQRNGWEMPGVKDDCGDYDIAVSDVKWFMKQIKSLGYTRQPVPENKVEAIKQWLIHNAKSDPFFWEKPTPNEHWEWIARELLSLLSPVPELTLISDEEMEIAWDNAMKEYKEKHPKSLNTYEKEHSGFVAIVKRQLSHDIDTLKGKR